MTLTTPTWCTDPALNAFRNRILHFKPEEIKTDWEDIIIPQGAAEIAVTFQDEEILTWCKTWFDFHMDHGFTIDEPGSTENHNMSHRNLHGVLLNDYCGNWGMAFALNAILPAFPEQRYKDAIVKIADYVIANAHRVQDNTITHGGFSENIWVDTLYYAAPTFTAAYKVTAERKYADAAIEQCLLHAKYLRSEQTAMFHHDADPAGQVRTINYWARGNGWIIAAIADTLAGVPKDMEGYDELVIIFRSLSEALVRLQHSNGLWRVMPENPDSHLETSGTAMILYGLAKGIELGLLESYVMPMIKRGYNEMLTWINHNGQLLGSQFPSGRGNWDNLKLTPFGENTYTTGFMMRLIATYQQLLNHRFTVN